MISAVITATTTYQKLSDLLVAAGITSVANNSVTSDTAYLLNRDTSINILVGAGFGAIPTGTQSTVTPLAAILINKGQNTNDIWIKSASSTASVEFVEGASAYENPKLSGLIGVITLTDNTVPKGDSNNLVNSSIVDNGTIVAVSEPIASTGYIKSSGTTGIGYATGAGGAVTQGTSRTTTVVCNTPTGAITLFSAAGSATPFSFTVTNASVAATDTVILSQKSGTDIYTTQVVSAVGAGSFCITLANASGTTTEHPVFNFCVLKGVAA